MLQCLKNTHLPFENSTPTFLNTYHFIWVSPFVSYCWRIQRSRYLTKQNTIQTHYYSKDSCAKTAPSCVIPKIIMKAVNPYFDSLSYDMFQVCIKTIYFPRPIERYCKSYWQRQFYPFYSSRGHYSPL